MRKLNEQKYCSWCGSEITFSSERAFMCDGCGYKDYLSPRPCSTAIIVQNGKVLLTRRAIKPFEGTLDLPGGFVDYSNDNSIEEAMYRELKKELSLSKSDLGEAKFYTSRANIYPWMNTEVQVMVSYFIFKVNDIDEKIKLDTNENSEYVFVDPSELKFDEISWEIDKEVLKKYLEKSHA